MLVPTTILLRSAARPVKYQLGVHAGRRHFSYSIPPSSTPGSSSSSVAGSSRSSSTIPKPTQANPAEQSERPRTPSWFLNSPTYAAAIRSLAWLMGYHSKTSTAIRETRQPYAQCAQRDGDESRFLHEECSLAPTYQTWFQITNLHVWLLTTRYRALPKTHGRIYVQELVNHFFLDVEHRMRIALSNTAPERVVKGYMKEMRDQWAGAGLALDLGLVGSDAELSGAVWRNVFAARGLDGKGEVIGKPGSKESARAVRSSGHSAADTDVSSVDASHRPLSERELADLPFHLFVFTAYLRHELKRLEAIPDEDVIAGNMGSFGSLESHMHAIERDFALEREERALLGLDDDVQIEPLHARSRSKGKLAAAA